MLRTDPRSRRSNDVPAAPRRGGRVDEPDPWISQTGRRRRAVQGRLVTLAADGREVCGARCTLQFTQHPLGWLVHGWNITDQAVLITTEDGLAIADLLGGIHD